jgi:hypothetical protein
MQEKQTQARLRWEHCGAEPNIGISNKYKPCAEQSWAVLGDGGAELAALDDEGTDLAAHGDECADLAALCGWALTKAQEDEALTKAQDEEALMKAQDEERRALLKA